METPELYFSRKREFHHMTLVGLAYFALIFLDIFAVSGVVKIICEITGNSAWMDNDWAYYAACLLPSYLLCMPVCFVLLYFAEADPPEKKRLSGKFLLGAAMVCITGIQLGSYLGNFSTGLLGELLGREIQNNVSDLITSSSILPTVVFACVLAPVLEELFFRKLLLDRLRKYGELPAVVICAIGFGLYHGNLYQFFYAALLGAVFAYIYLKSGKIIYTIVFHAAVNVMGSVIPYAITSMMGDAEITEENLMENLPALAVSGIYGGFLILAAVAGAVILFANRKKLTFEKGAARFFNNDAVYAYLVNPGVILFILCAAYYFLRSLA